jgi:hypothetical protein
VSLILDALKKLEREKQAPDRGFLVLAHLPWAARPREGRSRSLLLLGAVGLLAVGVAAVGFLRGRQPRPSEPAARPGAAAEPGPPPASAVPTAAASLPVPLAPAPAPRSPLPLALGVPTPPPAAAPPEVELRLNAISEQDGHRVAILNDRLVREGDLFDGIRVVRIGETEVEVEVNGQRRLVRF